MLVHRASQTLLQAWASRPVCTLPEWYIVGRGVLQPFPEAFPWLEDTLVLLDMLKT